MKSLSIFMKNCKIITVAPLVLPITKDEIMSFLLFTVDFTDSSLESFN